MQHYFVTKKHYKITKESVKIAIKKSISRPKDVVNYLFQHTGRTLRAKSTSHVPKSCEQVKDFRKQMSRG